MEIIKSEILQHFNKLTFVEETHKYSVENKPLKISVSGLCSKFKIKVNFAQKAIDKDKRLGLEIGSTQKEWNTKSEKACKKGTKVHLFGELYPFNKKLKPKDKFEEAIVKFWNDMPDHIIPVIMELQMYHKEYMFAGTGDILLFNTKDGTFIWADYKTNEDLFKNFMGKTLVHPFTHLLDNGFNGYQLQLSFYQILFEQTGYKISQRIIVWLKPSGEYELYFTDNYTKELKEYLKNNKI